MSKFAVTLNYHGNYGYVEYDSENKKAEIVLGVAEAKAKVEKFLIERLQNSQDIQENFKDTFFDYFPKFTKEYYLEIINLFSRNYFSDCQFFLLCFLCRNLIILLLL